MSHRVKLALGIAMALMLGGMAHGCASGGEAENAGGGRGGRGGTSGKGGKGGTAGFDGGKSGTSGTSGSAGTDAGGSSGDGSTGPCGNGVLDPGEKCDTAITTGTGVCPGVTCESTNPCQPATRQGTGCQAECVTMTITMPDNGTDNCCPSGATPATDPDCGSEVCGDGQVTGNEKCDTSITSGAGACPTTTSCATTVACSPKTITGMQCQAECVTNTITQPTNGDNCCPMGANANNDNDCNAVCGNRIIETADGEKCDGNCPTSCTSPDRCRPQVLQGTAAMCTAECVAGAPITACTSGDQCCPASCTNTGAPGSDTDCPLGNLCGNGQIDTGEFCDNGAGSPTPCPTSCPTTNPCQPRTLTGTNCTRRCVQNNITTCTNGDNCCPTTCNATNDNNCNPVCGNGVIESGERCDGNCPTSCTGGTACAPRVLTGTNCTRECVTQNITTCTNGDGCCPTTCNTTNDNNCSAVCGNGVVEPGEQCDSTDRNVCAASCRTAVNECLFQAQQRGEMTGTGSCAACMCADGACRTPLEACYLATDTASGGPRSGTSKAVLCGELITCVRTTDCTTATYGMNHCLCGNLSQLACLGSQPGPCQAEIKAAAESNSALDILNRQTNTTYALGRANAVATCSTTAMCNSVCL